MGRKLGRGNSEDREFYKFIHVWNASTSKKEVMKKLGKGNEYLDELFSRAVALGVLMREFRPGSRNDLKESFENEYIQPVPCTEATTASRGSFEKVVVLRQRVERGEDLWHPEDNPNFAQPNESFARAG